MADDPSIMLSKTALEEKESTNSQPKKEEVIDKQND